MEHRVAEECFSQTGNCIRNPAAWNIYHFFLSHDGSEQYDVISV